MGVDHGWTEHVLDSIRLRKVVDDSEDESAACSAKKEVEKPSDPAPDALELAVQGLPPADAGIGAQRKQTTGVGRGGGAAGGKARGKGCNKRAAKARAKKETKVKKPAKKVTKAKAAAKAGPAEDWGDLTLPIKLVKRASSAKRLGEVYAVDASGAYIVGLRENTSRLSKTLPAR